MYTAFFGLTELPFSIAPDPRFLFMSKRHREALAHLLYGIQEGGGFVQLTGEVGTGKTTLCRGFLEQVPENVDVALILNPRVSEKGLVSSICDELRIDYSPQQTLKELVDVLNAHLLKCHAEGSRSVLIIDEAQNLSSGVLEQIRLLTNLETNRDKLLRIVLIGQPELGAMLARKELRQLQQRITARYHLQPLSKEETCQYIKYRLAVAGIKRTLFAPLALNRVYRYSDGIPRLINIICDRALLGAYTKESWTVGPRVVTQAAKEVLAKESSKHFNLRRWGYSAALIVTFISGIGVAGLFAEVRGSVGQSLQGGIVWAQEKWQGWAPRILPGQETKKDLAWMLSQNTEDEGKLDAFNYLLSLWGIVHHIDDPNRACESIQTSRLYCLTEKGGWQNLRRYNRPVILKLATTSGLHRYAVLQSLIGDEAKLLIGKNTQTISLKALEPYWFGEFILVWSSPAGVEQIVPGTYSDEVLWLRRRLNGLDERIDAPTADTDDGRYFDNALKLRVISFQRGRSLRDDGIVDIETLIHLNTALHSPVIPVLTKSAMRSG
ncbi:MAG: AAA family ATPase [Gammaproteobacteria bacterium]|nr:AAA family ATPase [Gammaproteobacteria bacterium]